MQAKLTFFLSLLLNIRWLEPNCVPTYTETTVCFSSSLGHSPSCQMHEAAQAQAWVLLPGEGGYQGESQCMAWSHHPQ